MKQFTLHLVKEKSRPIVELKSWNNIYALLDTGAIYPIWTADERILIRFGATLKEKGVSFGGFGGKTNGNLYELKNIVIGGLIFSRLDIIVCNDLKNSPFQMILSATMFTHLIYEVDAKNWKFNVDIPDEESNIRNLQIRNKGGQLQVLCSSEFTVVDSKNIIIKSR